MTRTYTSKAKEPVKPRRIIHQSHMPIPGKHAGCYFCIHECKIELAGIVRALHTRIECNYYGD